MFLRHNLQVPVRRFMVLLLLELREPIVTPRKLMCVCVFLKLIIINSTDVLQQ